MSKSHQFIRMYCIFCTVVQVGFDSSNSLQKTNHIAECFVIITPLLFVLLPRRTEWLTPFHFFVVRKNIIRRQRTLYAYIENLRQSWQIRMVYIFTHKKKWQNVPHSIFFFLVSLLSFRLRSQPYYICELSQCAVHPRHTHTHISPIYTYINSPAEKITFECLFEIPCRISRRQHHHHQPPPHHHHRIG